MQSVYHNGNLSAYKVQTKTYPSVTGLLQKEGLKGLRYLHAVKSTVTG